MAAKPVAPSNLNNAVGKVRTTYAKNRNLNIAGNAKKDEFYTTLEDIEAEVSHYLLHFSGKTVYCNCDNPYESNFFRYFVTNFNKLKLKKLVCTCFEGRQSLCENVAHPSNLMPLKAVVTSVSKSHAHESSLDLNALFSREGNELTALQDNGDFRSQECLDLLDEADIVVTNPPFSLFREFVATLVAREKSFLVIGNINAVTYREIFPLIRDNRIWLGASIHSGDRMFYVPDSYDLNASGCGVDASGRKFIRVKGIRWFTNLDYEQLHIGMPLVAHFDANTYPKYDNYNAIEVGKTSLIPCDYSGLMGVPITFIDKYCPDEFELVMLANGNARTNNEDYVLRLAGYHRHAEDKGGVGVINGRRVYARLIIKRKGSPAHESAERDVHAA